MPNLSEEEARAILAAFHAEHIDATQAEAEQAWARWLVQYEIVYGPQSEELSRLHAAAVAGDAQAEEQMAAIINAMHQEAELRLAREGLPKEWRPK